MGISSYCRYLAAQKDSKRSLPSCFSASRLLPIRRKDRPNVDGHVFELRDRRAQLGGRFPVAVEKRLRSLVVAVRLQHQHVVEEVAESRGKLLGDRAEAPFRIDFERSFFEQIVELRRDSLAVGLVDLLREFVPDPNAVEVFTCGPGIGPFERQAAKEKFEEPTPRFFRNCPRGASRLGYPRQTDSSRELRVGLQQEWLREDTLDDRTVSSLKTHLDCGI